ncbi:MAG: protein kinase, partial [Planctomycetes bacterium]|nr:protein kinase [Planctomycetota bacterium]
MAGGLGPADYWLAMQGLHLGLLSRAEVVELLTQAGRADAPGAVESVLRARGGLGARQWNLLLAARDRALAAAPSPAPADRNAPGVGSATEPDGALSRVSSSTVTPVLVEDGAATAAGAGAGSGEPSIPSGHTPSPLLGKAFGRYVVLSELGRGGMGTVFKALQPDLDRIVALKILAEGECDAEGVRRFFREAQAAARLTHPNIVAVYDVGEAEGRYYIAMEYLDGATLRRYARDRKVPVRTLVGVVRDVARALHYAHEHGIVHRDVKPHNIMVQARNGEDAGAAGDPQGAPEGPPQAKIADFGLAKEIDSRSQLTLSGQILGSPSYMAPEQAGGTHREIGPRTDVYALGATLYDVLTGRPPFEGENAYKILVAVLNDPPPAPRTLAARLHRDVETIILKAMEKDPARRYGSALALAEDLERFLEGEPILARPPGRLERVARRLRRHASVVLTVTAALAVVAGLVAWSADALGRAHADVSAKTRAYEEAERERLRSSAVYMEEVRRRASAESGLEARARELGEAQARVAVLEGELGAREKEASEAKAAAEAAQRTAAAAGGAARRGEREWSEAYQRSFLTVDVDRALAELARAAKADPTAAEIWVRRGELFLEAGKPDQAARELDQAIAVAGRAGGAGGAGGEGGAGALYAHYLRAQARRAQGNEEGCIADLREVLARVPDSDLALVAAADLWHGRGDRRREAQVLEQVLARAPDAPGARERLGEAWLAVEDWPKAVAVFDRLAERQPASGPGPARRGEARRRAGELEAARADAEAALAREPACVPALRLRAALD